MKDNNENVYTAIIKFIIEGEEYLVPLDNWNKAVEEMRTNAVVIGDELHFFNDSDYEKIKQFNDGIK